MHRRKASAWGLYGFYAKNGRGFALAIAPLLFFIAGCASREAGMQQQASGSTQRPQSLVGNLYGNRRAPQES
jgi:hypothetical protein